MSATGRPEREYRSAQHEGGPVNRRRKVIVGLSGGVDSSVAAWLLKQQGYDVVGVFMKNWEDDDTEEYCTSRTDLVDAAAVADVIGIELEAVNFAAEYRERVFAHFLREYAAGRTPNPDVLCNSEIKFRAFLDHALALGADCIATGHYARVRRAAGDPARVELLKAVDATKDQSYFLHRLDQAQLAPALFPLGEIAKREVRAIAKAQGIPTWAKKDSTGICFIGERPFRDFLARYLPRTPGAIETPDGRVVGRHWASPTTRWASGRDWASAVPATAPTCRGSSPPRIARATSSSRCRGTTTRCCIEVPSTRWRCTGSPARPRCRTCSPGWARRRAIGCRTPRARSPSAALAAGGRASPRRSGHRPRASTWCSTTARSASGAG